MEQRPESPAQGKTEIKMEERDTPTISRLRALLGKELRIVIRDGRVFLGQFACTDKELNLVLTQVYELPVDFQNDHLVENGRFVGMLMFPWAHIVSVELHAAPNSDSDEYT
ncbi:hypothetical protein FRC19_001233 [Serendipita sp. 401]|nr:hypothetical protein FRC19_001233 [Serendipita sp. 401]KAG9054278.1 hypothetical protein FS842_005605 [Serendipita sp. 407]